MTDVRTKKAMQAAGQWNEDGVWRAARARRHECGAWVMVGLDDPRCAWTAVVDPTPLSVLGEALALLQGRLTYTLSRTAGRYELDRRCAIKVARDQPGTDRHDVVAAHQCGAAVLPSIPSVIKIRAAPDVHDEPPF